MTGGLFSPDVYQKTDMRSLRDICQFINKHINKNPFCVETGCTWQFLPSALQHHTTNNILKYVAMPHDGMLITIDIEDRSEVIQKLLMSDNISSDCPLGFLVDESVRAIGALARGDWIFQNKDMRSSGKNPQIDLLCLDSSEDAQHMVDEYLAAEPALAEKHYLLIDDIHNPGSVKYLDMVPLMKEKGYDWVQVPTPVGMMVCAKGYPVPKNLMEL